MLAWKKEGQPPKEYWEELPSTRKEAKRIGSRFYYTGKPDIDGVVYIRYASTGQTANFYNRKNDLTLRKKREQSKEYKTKYKTYRDSHKDYFKEKQIQWRKDNPEYNKKYKEDYYLDQENKKRRNKIKREWEKKYKDDNPSYKVIKSHYSRVNQLIRNPKSVKTMKLLGCNKKTFIKHIKDQFEDGMTFENYGKIWHIDHIIPLGEFYDLANNIQEQKIAFNYKNQRPLFKNDNLSRPKPRKSKKPITKLKKIKQYI